VGIVICRGNLSEGEAEHIVPEKRDMAPTVLRIVLNIPEALRYVLNSSSGGIDE
jgi:hypothetical protein